jgi:hypothetical protein
LRNELLDHAARLLHLAPAGCASADLLHRRTCLDLGCELSYASFVESLGSHPDRFAVLSSRLADRRAWHASERAAYDAALQDAGLAGVPIVMLAERRQPHGHTAHGAGSRHGPGAPNGPTAANGPGAEPPRTDHDLFAVVHESLAELLRGTADDEALRHAVGCALDELVSATVRESGGGAAGAAPRAPHAPLRNSTVHHCSSTSSASTAKPAAAAAVRTPAASSTRIPDRIAHPDGSSAA